jgi:hypothetical protein
MHWPLWNLITRLGEAQLVLPLALVAALTWFAREPSRSPAFWWSALLSLAILVTAATKVAFIGWGFGSAALDFTGISGHTMFATAVYPLLLATFVRSTWPHTRRLAVAAGFAIALLVGVSRLALGVHSVTEVVAGWLAGGAVSIAVLARGTPALPALGVAVPVLVAAWIAFMPVASPSVDTHGLVTRVALKLSGHTRPYTRSSLMH